jgi:hypothetical protein
VNSFSSCGKTKFNDPQERLKGERGELAREVFFRGHPVHLIKRVDKSSKPCSNGTLESGCTEIHIYTDYFS